jgi:hypothetical protein
LREQLPPPDWWWRQQVPWKRWYPFFKLHSTTSRTSSCLKHV